MGEFDELVGSWQLIEAADVVGKPTVQFQVDPEPGWGWVEVDLDTGCTLGGPWRASRTGELVAAISCTTACACGRPHENSRRWLHDTVRFARRGEILLLLGRDGHVTARLASRPEMRAASGRGSARRVASLPSDLEPIDGEQLLGAWQPVLARPASGRPWQNVQFHINGRWTTFPRGNVASGRWVAGPHGILLALYPYAKTLAWSPVEEVDTWLLDVARAGLDGELLVVFDDDGHQRQHLRRTRPPS